MGELETIIELSHEFGTVDYVRGGGGNTSVKNSDTLWVKPSGTTLAGLTPESMVAMSREKIDALYSADMPRDVNGREARVKDMMAEAVVGGGGRPSVEAPLHNVFEAKYIVHTHPAMVNGMTCAQDGEAVCKRLFPDALWVEYIDPGYTLCMEVRSRIEDYRKTKGHEPELLFLQNHGVFITGANAEGIQSLYSHAMDLLDKEYRMAGISTEWSVEDAPAEPETEALLKSLLGEQAEGLASCAAFPVAPGPISPDHLVYAKAYPYTGPLTAEGIALFREEKGYLPNVVQTEHRVYGVGTSMKNAELALELAQDGALVARLTEAFGGISFMTDAQRRFIENWEVESYRAAQSSN